MTIKHIVISGGGPSGFYAYGAAKYLEQQNFWNINNIKTIYGTSIGAFIAVLLCLKYDWTITDDYLIKRPWNKLLTISPDDLLKVWDEKGILGIECAKEAIRPLLDAKDLSIDITLKEFYEFTNIELHVFGVNLNDILLKETDISYKTHPDMLLVKALAITTAFPFVFKPVIDEDKCYIDGGLMMNFPLEPCLNSTGCDPNEILAFQNIWTIENENNTIINENTSLLNYCVNIISSVIRKFNNTSGIKVPNTVNCLIESGGVDAWKSTISSKETREICVKKGESLGFMFYKYKSNESNIKNIANNVNDVKNDVKNDKDTNDTNDINNNHNDTNNNNTNYII